MATREQIQKQRDRLVKWGEQHHNLLNHIQNGVCRELYPQVVADLAKQYLEQVLEIETDNLMDMVEDAR